MKTTLVIFLIGFTLFSCKKKAESIAPVPSPITPPVPPPTDTVKPGSYYPVYPGSWWKYEKKDGTFFTDHTSTGYEFVKYATSYYSAGSSQPATHDSAYVPLYNGSPVFGYKRLRYPPFHGGDEAPPVKYAFLSEVSGNYSTNISESSCDPHVFMGNIPPGAFCPQEILLNVQKTLNATGDSILITRGIISNAFSGLNTSEVTYRIYTKNVGLTFYAGVDTLQHDTIEKWKLVDHYIAPH